jgi:tRNA-intron lyase
VTLGVKYGADFLAYTADPLTCHAKYLVVVLPEHETSIDAAKLVQAERMANTVKKDLLVAFGHRDSFQYFRV